MRPAPPSVLSEDPRPGGGTAGPSAGSSAPAEAGAPAGEAASADDAHLVAEVRAGRRERYGELIRRHQRAVAGYLWQRLHDPQAVEELAHEVFVRCFERLDQLQEPARFLAWAFRVACNLAADRARRAPPETLAAEPAADEDDPAAAAEQTERRRWLARAIALLPEEVRAPLVLRYVEGREYRDIAALLAVPEGALRTRVCRTLARLRAEAERAGL